jgi:hypothetical protein
MGTEATAVMQQSNLPAVRRDCYLTYSARQRCGKWGHEGRLKTDVGVVGAVSADSSTLRRLMFCTLLRPKICSNAGGTDAVNMEAAGAVKGGAVFYRVAAL